MYRRFNYTKRKEIKRQDCQISLHRTGGDLPYFSVRLVLGEYGFDASARIRVDAWRSNASQRWDFGTVSGVTPPSLEERVLRDVPATARFKVSVVAADGSGLLYGVSPALTPKREDDPNDSLLPIEFDDDLGNEVWRLDFGNDGDSAVLKLNGKIEGAADMAGSDQIFRPLVLPEVFREVLRHALLVQGTELDDDRGSDWDDWIKLAMQRVDGEPPPGLEGEPPQRNIPDTVDWINRAVAAFATKHELTTPERFAEAMKARS